MAEAPLKKAIEGKDVALEWMPFELRPYPNKPLRPEEPFIQQEWKNSVLPLAAQFGVHMVLPQVSPMPYTHFAHEGYQFAKERGKGDAYHHRVFAAYFQEGQDIGDIAILTKLAGSVGLDPSKFKDSLEQRTYRQVHLDALRHAYEEAHITAVPTMVIGKRVLRGLHDEKALSEVIRAEMARP